MRGGASGKGSKITSHPLTTLCLTQLRNYPALLHRVTL